MQKFIMDKYGNEQLKTTQYKRKVPYKRKPQQYYPRYVIIFKKIKKK